MTQFGAMGSTSFLGFSYLNLLLVFSEPVIFRNLYNIFRWDFLWVFFILFLFYFLYHVLGKLVTTEIRFFALKSNKEKGTG